MLVAPITRRTLAHDLDRLTGITISKSVPMDIPNGIVCSSGIRTIEEPAGVEFGSGATVRIPKASREV
jgi:hypothetical protein